MNLNLLFWSLLSISMLQARFSERSVLFSASTLSIPAKFCGMRLLYEMSRSSICDDSFKNWVQSSRPPRLSYILTSARARKCTLFSTKNSSRLFMILGAVTQFTSFNSRRF